MVTGIALFGVLTADLAAFMLEREDEQAPEPADDSLDEILRQLGDLQAQLAAGRCASCGAAHSVTDAA